MKLNPLAILPPLMLALVIVIGINAQGWAQWRAGVPMIIAFGWGAYFLAMAGYAYDGTRYSWFKGLWRRSVDARSIRQVVFRRERKSVAKVRFECDGKAVTTRTDFPVAVQFVKRMVEDYQLKTITERLPWWSV